MFQYMVDATTVWYLPEYDLEPAEAERVDCVRDGESVVGHHAGHCGRHLDLRPHQQIVGVLPRMDRGCHGIKPFHF